VTAAARKMVWKVNAKTARKWGLLPPRKKPRDVELPATREQAVAEFLERMREMFGERKGKS